MEIGHASVALTDDRHSTLMIVASLLFLASVSSQAVPIWSGRLAPSGSVKGEYCNVAVIRSQRPLIVRAGPERTFAKITCLPRGSVVYSLR